LFNFLGDQKTFCPAAGLRAILAKVSAVERAISKVKRRELTACADGPLPLRDSFIGAIVRSGGHRIVTRDTAPLGRMGCKLVDPWA